MTTLRTPLYVAALAATAIASGCGDDDPTTASTAASTTAPQTQTQAQGGPGGGGPGGGGPGGGQGMQSFSDVDLNSDGESAGGANTAAVVAATKAFLATLDDTQKKAVELQFTDNVSRVTWSNFPTTTVPRKGAAIKDLGADGKAAALKLVQTMTSAEGFSQIDQIRASDTWLSKNSSGSTSGFGEDLYYVAIYGTPSDTAPFQVQFGGHHLARNYTYNGSDISVTPDFVGTEPTSFEADGKTVQPLKAEADALFGMFAGLSKTQLASAKLKASYDDLVMGPGQDTGKFPATEGLKVSELGAAEKAKVIAAIKTYTSDAADGVAAAIEKQYESELDDTTISWSGNTDRDGENSYLRIDGPSVWIEFVNTRSMSTPNIHFHSVWRDKNNDYGSSNPSS